jgi:two-component system phosphate regulon sensor histidine kinase PhoR
MRWRLFFPFVLLQLGLLAGLALGIARWVDEASLRGTLLGLVGATALIGVAATLVLSRVVARRFTDPLRKLHTAVERMDGNPDSLRVLTEGTDEVGRLGETFNMMSARLDQRIAQLEQDRHQLRAILSGMIEGVVALDAEQRVLYANERAAALLEFHAKNPVGRRLWEVVRQRSFLDMVQRALAAAEPYREELSWHGRTQRSLTVHLAQLAANPPRGAVLVLHDTSELRRLERLRQEFVANVSHELKTPLSVIKACVETLLDGAIDDAEHRGPFLQQIAAQGDRLHMLILDLLSLARIESGEQLFEFRAVSLADVVNTCVERHRARAESRRQTLLIGNSEEDPPLEEMLTAWADEEAVDHILDNLLDNAVKYTPEGGTIRIGWRPENDQTVIEVVDTGIGIPEHDLPRVFERFYRVDKARSRELGGTGLGLAIVKHLTQAMHGTVGVTSRIGRGTIFTVRLPRAESSDNARAVQMTGRARDHR